MRACVWHKCQEQETVQALHGFEKNGKKQGIVKVEAGKRTRREGAVQRRAQRPVLALHWCHRVHVFPITDISLFCNYRQFLGGHMDSESFHLITVFLVFERQVLAHVTSRRHEVGAKCHLWLSPELDYSSTIALTPLTQCPRNIW